MKQLTLDTAKGNIGPGYFIFVLRFTYAHKMSTKTFCDDAQTILYDDIGSSGHFRMAPKNADDLTPDFIEAAAGVQKPPGFYPRDENEIIAAFILRETDPDLPISEELAIFPGELGIFCEEVEATVEQLDIKTMY